METENMLGNSRAKLVKKNLDMIVANNLKVPGAGFAGDTNVVTLITQDEETELPLLSKEETAVQILDKICCLLSMYCIPMKKFEGNNNKEKKYDNTIKNNETGNPWSYDRSFTSDGLHTVRVSEYRTFGNYF